MTEERCEKCEHFHRLKHNFKKGIGFEESTCCDVLLHLPDSMDDTKPWVQEVSRLGMCEMFTEVKQDKPTTKNDLGVDCISRTSALDSINWAYNLSDAYQKINDLPSLTPQNQVYPLCEDCHTKMDEVRRAYDNAMKQEPILDKIRAEILEEKECAYADFERYKVEYLGQDWEDALDSLPQDDFRYGMERAIELIDKYKAEIEPQESEDKE